MPRLRKSNKKSKSRKSRRIYRRNKIVGGGCGCNKMTGGGYGSVVIGGNPPYPINSYDGDPNNPSIMTAGRNVPDLIGGNNIPNAPMQNGGRKSRKIGRRPNRKMRGGGLLDLIPTPFNLPTGTTLNSAQLLTGNQPTNSAIYPIALPKFSNLV